MCPAPYAEWHSYVTTDGREYVFDRQTTRFVLSFSGYGMPPLEFVSERGPYQHGETLLDYRLAPRRVTLAHRVVGGRRQEYWENRATLLDLLRPNRGAAGSKGVLTLTTAQGDEYHLDVVLESGLIFPARSQDTWDEFSLQVEMVFLATDPTFYDPREKSALWGVNDLGGLWFWSGAHPNDLFFPVSFGADVVSGQQQIHCSGTWRAYPTLTIVGPLHRPVVSNVTTGKAIQLFYDVSAGESVILSLPFGDKRVYNNSGRNLVGTVDPSSDLEEFSIAPEPEAGWCGVHSRPCGLNVIEVSGSGGVVGQTQVSLVYHDRYLGI